MPGIFLNGKAVDKIKTTAVTDGNILALSAAMPGLVGATFRRGGRYAAMRSNVSHKDENLKTSGESRIITLKLFTSITVK